MLEMQAEMIIRNLLIILLVMFLSGCAGMMKPKGLVEIETEVELGSLTHVVDIRPESSKKSGSVDFPFTGYLYGDEFFTPDRIGLLDQIVRESEFSQRMKEKVEVFEFNFYHGENTAVVNNPVAVGLVGISYPLAVAFSEKTVKTNPSDYFVCRIKFNYKGRRNIVREKLDQYYENGVGINPLSHEGYTNDIKRLITTCIDKAVKKIEEETAA